jgi:protein-L-isoaspartate(D-aspartate) O-methyltransferase
MTLAAADAANQRMVDRLIAEGALWSSSLIAAFRHTPRHRFLDRVYLHGQGQEAWRAVPARDPGPQEIELLYSDRALITRLGTNNMPISSSSQPSLMAEMLEDLAPGPGHRVLEIGAGTGYNAALLAYVAGAGRVHAVDVDQAVLAEAAEHLETFAERSVQLHHGDGRERLPGAALFDRLMVTAATPDLEPAWLAQLADGGVLVAPVVLAPGLAFVVRGQVRHGVLVGNLTRSAYFMPLRAEDETPDQETDPPFDSLRSRPAPWAGWFDRQRPRVAWHSFLQAVVFYGWLRGLTVEHRGTSPGPSGYAVRWQDAVCWLGVDDWQVNGPLGQELGEALWQAYLTAGGPWPIEFRLTATPHGGLTATGTECYLRQGPRCQQHWELVQPRQRAGWR